MSSLNLGWKNIPVTNNYVGTDQTFQACQRRHRRAYYRECGGPNVLAKLLLWCTKVLCSKALVLLVFWRKTFLARLDDSDSTRRHLLASIEAETKAIPLAHALSV